MLCGEGEESFPALMQALAEKRTPAGIPGLAARDEHGAVSPDAGPAFARSAARPIQPSLYGEAQGPHCRGKPPGLSVFLLVLFIWCEGKGTVF